MPDSMYQFSYGIGFICATALLHATGVGLGIAMDKTGQVYRRRIAQVSGAAMAIAGLVMVTVP